MTRRQYSFVAIGTRWQISTSEELGDREWERLQSTIAARIDEFDQAYSRFRQDSLVAQISRQAGSYELPPDGPKLVNFYEKLYRATNGLVTPLIGQVMSDSGYDANYSFQTSKLSAPPAWDEAIELHGGNLLVKRPALLDFGAAGKGYLVDIVGRLLEDGGVKTYLVNAGGDVLHRATAGQKIRVGLENPLDASQALGLAELGKASLCASSGSRRRWGRYHHIFNPSTLEPADGIIATWAVAPDAMTADGLATALFFAEPKHLSQFFKFDYAVLHKDMTMRHSSGFPAEMFKKDGQ